MRNRRLILLAAAAAAIAPARYARAYSSIVAFGDSLSDTGNVYSATLHLYPSSPPNSGGRFSNGPVWLEDFAADLSLPSPTASRSGGRDFAYGGARTGAGSVSYLFFSFPNVGTQISSYLSSNTPAVDQLFVVWGGGNDFIDGQTNPSIPVNNVANHITALANAGAHDFVVPNLPPLGEVPRFRGTANEATMNALSSQFNTQLATTLSGLRSSLGVRIYGVDVGGTFVDLLANPSAFGLTNVTTPALSGSTVAPNPDQYLFWDDIHPTRVGHALLGQEAADVVNTHTWIASTASGSWTATQNWEAPGTPSAAWIANVVNTSTQPRVAVVSSNSTVKSLQIAGTSTGTMICQVAGNATLSVTGSIAINSGGMLDLQGHTAAGSFTQSPGGTLAVELARAGQLDLLTIGGNASFGGNVSVRSVGGFVPLPGQAFELVTFGSRSGDVTVNNDTDRVGLRFARTFSASALMLTASALSGDANLDATVDTLDFNALAANFGGTGKNWLAGDFNGDATVDTLDFNSLAAHFGQVTPPQQADAPFAAVPEPRGSVVVMVMMALAGVRGRGRAHFGGVVIADRFP
jgi:phospholipase/lecithinase/hemolysin